MIGTMEYKQEGEVILYTHTSATVKDTPIYVAGIGAMLPCNSADANVQNAFRVLGVYRGVVANSIAVTVGANVFYDSAAGTIVLVRPSSGFLLGKAITAGTGNAGGTVSVDIAINKLDDGLLDATALEVRTAITTAGNATYTAANVVKGFIIRDPAGGNRTDVTPTAAELLAQARTVFGNIAVGSNFIFEIANTADAAESVTVSAGSGVTMWPATQTIAQNTNGRFRCVFTNVTASSEAATIYKM